MKQILILEDNELTRNKLIRLIESMNLNINVFAFSNEEEALGCALTHRIDLFLVDIILRPQIKNDFSGIHFTEKIKSVHPAHVQRWCLSHHLPVWKQICFIACIAMIILKNRLMSRR